MAGTGDAADVDELAVRLARARQQLAHDGVSAPTWDHVDDQEQQLATLEAKAYLKAAHRAGIVLAAVDPGDIPAPPRLTAMVRGLGGRPLDRDEYARHLAGEAPATAWERRVPILSVQEAQAVAALLDELAGVYREEDLGHFARELAVRIYDRLGL